MILGVTLDQSQFINHGGCSAIVIVVLLGNLGVPVLEETVLLVAGYFIWRG